MARTLRISDRGADVRALQDALNFQVRRLPPLEVDGSFGPQTRARVVEFQKSNKLSPDGAAGPNTMARLFETEKLVVAVNIAATTTRSGIAPPRLIPPLTLPGLPPSTPTLPTLNPIQLFPSGSARLPKLTDQGQTLALRITVPVRNDPADILARSQQSTFQLLNTLPLDFPFRATIIGTVTPPVKTPGDPDRGFKWGVDPVFELKKVGPPVEFAVGLKGQARYTLQVVSSGASGLKLGVFVGGDFKATLDYTSEQATSRPLLQIDGSVTTGLGGVF